MTKEGYEMFLEYTMDAIRKTLNSTGFFDKYQILSLAIDNDYVSCSAHDKEGNIEIDVHQFYR